MLSRVGFDQALAPAYPVLVEGDYNDERMLFTWSTYCRAAAFSGLMPLSKPATKASWACVV